MLCCDTMYKAFSFIKCLTLIIKCVILFSINIYIPNLMLGQNCFLLFHIVKTDVYDIY